MESCQALPIYYKHFIWVTFQALQGVSDLLVCIPCNHTRRTPWICSIQMSGGSEPQFAWPRVPLGSAHPNRRDDGAELAEHLSPVLCSVCCGRQRLNPNPRAVPKIWSLNQAPQFCSAGSLSHEPHQHLNERFLGVMQVSWYKVSDTHSLFPPCRGPMPPAPAADSSTPGQLHAHDGAGLLCRQWRRLRDHHRCPLLSAPGFVTLFLLPVTLLFTRERG